MKTKLLKFALCAMALLPMGAWAEGWTFDFFNYCTTSSGNINEGGAYQIYPTINSTSAFTVNGAKMYTITTPSINANFGIYGTTSDETVTPAFKLSNVWSSATDGRIGLMATGNTSRIGFQNLLVGETITLVANAQPTIEGDSPNISLTSTTEGSKTDVTYGSKTRTISNWNTYVYTVTSAGMASLKFSGSNTIYSVTLTPIHSVTVNYNGSGLYGTASAAASSVLEGNTTTITALPATGYKVTNWAVSGTGATIDPSGDSNSNTTTITMGTDDATVTCTFAIQTYTVTHTLTGATATSGSTGEDAATYGTGYTAVFKANDGYLLPSAITVTAGDSDITASCTWTKATGTVSIPGASITDNIEITVTATKAVVTKVWTFEQYEGTKDGSNDREVITNTSGTSVFDYNGLYIHNNGGGHTVGARKQNSRMSLLNSSTTSITVKDSECANFSGIVANASNFAVDCYAIETPGAGTVSVTTYAGSSGNGFYIFSGTTLKVSYSASANKETHTSTYTTTGVETIWIVPTSSIYLQEVKFVPTGVDEGASKTITISAAGYATFGATENYTWNTATYPNLKAYYVSSVSASEARLTEISAANGIPANVGVIFAGDAGTYKLTTVKTATALGETNYLKACLADYTLRADNSYTNTSSTLIAATSWNYTLAAGPTFKHSSGSGTLAAGKAFLRTTVDVVDAARGLELVFDEDETTGIETVKVQKEEVTNGEYYDLMGRRVANPTKGLYIVNGKKVFIK